MSHPRSTAGLSLTSDSPLDKNSRFALASLVGLMSAALLFACDLETARHDATTPSAHASDECRDGTCKTSVQSVGVCGDGVCDCGESTLGSCATDCSKHNGPPSGRFECGDGVCQAAEDETSCPSDCGAIGCCVADSECGDGNECTDDVCTDFVCQNVANTAPCDDGDLCTQADTCADGVCVGADPVVCGTTVCHEPGVCDPQTGLCESAPVADGQACNDTDACSYDETCQAGACVGTTLDCDDGDDMTSDVCGENATCAYYQSDFLVKNVKYDFIDNRITVCMDYDDAADPQAVLGKIYETAISVEGVPTLDTWSRGHITSSILDAGGCPSWMIYWPTEAELAQIHALYPDGEVPYRVTFRMSDTWTDIVTAPVEVEDTGTVEIIELTDNYTFSVAIVQAQPPGQDLSTLDICLVKDDNWGGTGYVPFGVDTDCVARWDWGTNAADITVRTVPLEDVLFSANTYTTITDVTSHLDKGEPRGSDIDVYSFARVGEYWPSLLQKHGIVDTRLKKNPSFATTFLGPYPAEDTLQSSDHGAVKAYWADIVAANNVDLSDYDFVIYAYYRPETMPHAFWGRGFAAGRSAYVPVNMFGSGIVFNEAFLTMVHEMGHQMFSANDLYSGFSLQYPAGVPDPNVANFPLTDGCIMGKKFAWAPYSSTVALAYDTESYESEYDALGIERFHTQDPANFVLCADTIVEVMGGVENPNCSLADFYAGACGDCTSLDYLTCTTSP